MDSKDSMDIGQHRRSFGTPTKMSMSKFMVLPSAVVSRSAALPGTGRIYLCSVQGIAAVMCGYLRSGAGRYFLRYPLVIYIWGISYLNDSDSLSIPSWLEPPGVLCVHNGFFRWLLCQAVHRIVSLIRRLFCFSAECSSLLGVICEQ